MLAVLAVAGVVWAVTRAPAKAANPQAGAPKPALTVTTAQPQTTQLPITLSANGNITAWQEAVVGSESNGLRLSEVRVNVGDTVRAGQVLATFAAESVLADVAQTKANLAEAEANARKLGQAADEAACELEAGRKEREGSAGALGAWEGAGWDFAAGTAILGTAQLTAPVTAAAIYVSLLKLPESDMQWTLAVRPTADEVTAVASGAYPKLGQHSLELWLITDAGPVSLGLLPTAGEGKLKLPAGVSGTQLTLAVSLEPVGGSPTGLPTGPVLTSGPAIKAV